VGNTREFLGVPYAKPPLGNLRFAPPQPPDPWTTTRDASAFGPSCPQNPGALAASGTMNEDCLTINVFSPRDAVKVDAAHPGLPVMVFIHGGAFISGGSSQYDGQKLSETGHQLVVTLNYRLGALGFLARTDLDQSRPTDSPSGIDAIRDQQLALRWVQDNIGAFGGNPSNVTIFGESAGSMSVCLQMVSPTSRTFGQRFIMESAVCLGGLPIIDSAAARDLGTAMGTELCAGQADVLTCLRTKPAEELVAWRKDAGISGAGWGPSYNPADPILPMRPVELITADNYNKGPIIVGTNKNEWGLFQLIGLAPNIASIADFNAAIEKQFGQIAPMVKDHYKVATDADANATYVRVMTDSVFRCPTRALAQLATSKGSKVYLYSFEEGNAMHAFEIPYVFGNPNPALAPTLVEPLRATIQTYWTNFARAGDPNSAGQPAWPVYDLVAEQHMTLKEASVVGAQLAKDDCTFWTTLTAAK
jgi:para-nitrobenzyl esterase